MLESCRICLDLTKFVQIPLDISESYKVLPKVAKCYEYLESRKILSISLAALMAECHFSLVSSRDLPDCSAIEKS